MKYFKKLGYFAIAIMGMATLGVANANAQISTTTIGDNVDEIANTGFDVFQSVVLGKIFLILVAIALLAYIMRKVLTWLKSGGQKG